MTATITDEIRHSVLLEEFRRLEEAGEGRAWLAGPYLDERMRELEGDDPLEEDDDEHD